MFPLRHATICGATNTLVEKGPKEAAFNTNGLPMTHVAILRMRCDVLCPRMRVLECGRQFQYVCVCACVSHWMCSDIYLLCRDVINA
jgi:hypothetical protein